MGVRDRALADYLVGRLVLPMGAGEMARELGAALLDDAAERFESVILPDSGGKLSGEGLPGVGRDPGVDALVCKDPDFALKDRNEDENARLLVGLVEPSLKKSIYNPFPHGLRDPFAAEEGKLHVREGPEETDEGEEERRRDRNVKPDRRVAQGHGKDERRERRQGESPESSASR